LIRESQPLHFMAITTEAIQKLVEGDLVNCDAEQLATFERYAVTPYLAPILRYGKNEMVFVVARRENDVIYWEDVEEGFNVSALAADGRILEHFCNQDELGIALNGWIEGRSRPATVGPAKRVE
jgi:hypothetical protein